MKHSYLFLHGKDSGPNAPICTMTSLVNSFINIGELVDYVGYSWGYEQVYSQPFENVIGEVDAAVDRLKTAGADYIHIVSHSIGGNVALYYATLRSNFDSLVLLAPAHSVYSVKMQFLTEWARRKANALLSAEGYNTSTIEQFIDNDVNDVLIIDAKATDYLSYMNPTGNANMVLNIAKITRPLSVLLISGRNDISQLKIIPNIYNKIDKTSLSKYVITDDTHISVSGINNFNEILNWTKSTV